MSKPACEDFESIAKGLKALEDEKKMPSEITLKCDRCEGTGFITGMYGSTLPCPQCNRGTQKREEWNGYDGICYNT